MIQALLELAGLELPEEDVELLEHQLEAWRRSAAALLTSDTSEAEPIVTFDPRWR